MLKKIIFSFLFIAVIGIAGFRVYLNKQKGSDIIQLETLPQEPIFQARKQAIDKFAARIVFDSNRSGTFGIYSMRASGKELAKIYDSELQDMYPDPSPDGGQIVFTVAKTLERDSYSDIWLVNQDGSNPKLIAQNGTAATFSADGKTIYFERERSKIMAIDLVYDLTSDLAAQNEREIFPGAGEENKFGNYYVIKPRISDDGKMAAFISDKNGRWHSWIADLETKESRLMGRGCEATWYPDSQNLVWIQKKGAGALAGSGVYHYDLNTKISKKLQDDGPPMGHEYFPEITPDGKFLLYGACPHDQHAHENSNYQLYLKDLESGLSVRVTLDPFTNRWPKLLPE